MRIWVYLFLSNIVNLFNWRVHTCGERKMWRCQSNAIAKFRIHRKEITVRCFQNILYFMNRQFLLSFFPGLAPIDSLLSCWETFIDCFFYLIVKNWEMILIKTTGIYPCLLVEWKLKLRLCFDLSWWYNMI